MKLKAFLLMFVFCCSACLFADENEQDDLMWREAYKGNFSLTHKLMLTRKAEDISDEMLNQFVMAYVYYRIGQNDQIEPIFKGIDRFIEYRLFSKVK